MTPETLVDFFGWAAPRVLFLFGVGFLAANLKTGADLFRYYRRRRSALLIWEGPKPRFYGFNLALGVVFGLLIIVKLFVLRRPLEQLFGEAMMFLYYGYAFPLSVRIARGFYRDGVWSDSGFMRWTQISGVSWKEEGPITLVLISKMRSIARRLVVPGHLYGQARRLLLDRIQAREIHISGTGLDLGQTRV
jgi:hypothetical protein